MADIKSWNQQEEELIRAELSLILNSVVLIHAERLGRFLKFVVSETLALRSKQLNQFSIAIEVFDRDETFDPSIDAIVRVEAGRLRSKLLEYYDAESTSDCVQIKLPKRSYAATFDFRHSNDNSSKPTNIDSPLDTFPIYDLRKSREALEKPTIAVLPFVNMSPDPEQDYFADGFTEDLITDLSMLPEISVISRQSTFTYKNASVTVQQVCKELNANLVLEGSVRKVGNTVRITAQLVEGVTGKHLWAQRYDRNLDNIFEIQDEVNKKIVNALSIKLSKDERHQLENHGTHVIDAYDYLLRGSKESITNTMEGSARARYCFESALELDPTYAAAYARLSLNYIFRWIQGWNRSRAESIHKGLELALKAVALNDKLALAQTALCWAQLWNGEHDKAIATGQLAIKLDPDEVVGLERLALCLIFSGEAKSSLPLLDKARRLNPNGSYDFSRGIALYMLSNYNEAIVALRRSFKKSPTFIPSGLYLIASLVLSGNIKATTSTVIEFNHANPDYSFESNKRTQFKNTEDREKFFDALKLAGLT